MTPHITSLLSIPPPLQLPEPNPAGTTTRCRILLFLRISRRALVLGRDARLFREADARGSRHGGLCARFLGALLPLRLGTVLRASARLERVAGLLFRVRLWRVVVVL